MLAISMPPPVMHFPQVQKRPKLSLQTSELQVSYGDASKNIPSVLAAPNVSAITPTTFNTFTNTFELTHRPSPVSATSSPSTFRSDLNRDRVSRPQTPMAKRQSDRVYTVNLPYGTKPILKNGPFSKIKTTSISASPRSSTRKVFFPVPKRVGFRNPIEEEIVTKVYTARHSDLFLYESQTKETSTSNDNVDSHSEPVVTSGSDVVTATQTQRFACVETRQVPGTSDCESTASPTTTRKRRRWEWTLAPVQSELTDGKDESSLPQPKLEIQASPCGSSPITRKRSGSPQASPQKRKADCLESIESRESSERKRASTF